MRFEAAASPRTATRPTGDQSDRVVQRLAAGFRRRYSHALAAAQWRLTVAGESSSTRAVSSMLSPPK
jgi:hypothetical protein